VPSSAMEGTWDKESNLVNASIIEVLIFRQSDPVKEWHTADICLCSGGVCLLSEGTPHTVRRIKMREASSWKAR
jgi:hypothetical protein